MKPFTNKHSIAAASPFHMGGSYKESPLEQKDPGKKKQVEQNEKRGSRRSDGSIVGGIAGAKPKRKNNSKKYTERKDIGRKPSK